MHFKCIFNAQKHKHQRLKVKDVQRCVVSSELWRQKSVETFLDDRSDETRKKTRATQE